MSQMITRRSFSQCLPSVVKFSNKDSDGVVHPSGSPSGQQHVSNPLVSQQSSIDFSAPEQDEKVLDCSDWIPTVGCAAVLREVGHSADQPNVGGLHFPASMSLSTPSGVDRATTPKPAGTKAGMSVNPTERITPMATLAFLSARDVFDGPWRSSIIDALKPVNEFSFSIDEGDCLTYAHQNPRISWSGSILDSESVSDLQDLGTSLRAGGVDELAVLRFPRKFGWADSKEALAFWNPLLPVNAARIMFTPIDMNYIYVHLASGHILYLDLKWDGEDVDDDDLIQAIFLHIVDGCEVAR